MTKSIKRLPWVRSSSNFDDKPSRKQTVATGSNGSNIAHSQHRCALAALCHIGRMSAMNTIDTSIQRRGPWNEGNRHHRNTLNLLVTRIG